MAIIWAYGITTTATRLGDLLPKTIASLKAAGFTRPQIFADGVRHDDATINAYRLLGFKLVARYPAVRTFANWSLALAELYHRNPLADRFAIFQDDVLVCQNLRQYLDACEYPWSHRGYCNLYTAPHNERMLANQRNAARLANASYQDVGWHTSDQRGRGAVALVFPREVVVKLLSSRFLATWPQCHSADGNHRWRNLDAAIAHALRREGVIEYVHSPSLVQHVGNKSTMETICPPKWQAMRSATFPGEEFDAIKFLPSLDVTEATTGATK